MDYIIITNNELVKNTRENAVFVEGDYIDLLIKLRDYIHIGHKLISYPLGASIRMIYSPVKSVLISSDKGEFDENSLEILEGSIEKYKAIMGDRNIDYKNKGDYEVIDRELLDSAIEENDFIKTINF